MSPQDLQVEKLRFLLKSLNKGLIDIVVFNLAIELLYSCGEEKLAVEKLYAQEKE